MSNSSQHIQGEFPTTPTAPERRSASPETLPIETWAQILEYIYPGPAKPIILLPSHHHLYNNPDLHIHLSRPFTTISALPTAPLLTHSAIYAVAKPLRAASWTGTIIAPSATSILSTSACLHQHTREVKLVLSRAASQVPRGILDEHQLVCNRSRLRVELFPKLEKIEVWKYHVRDLTAFTVLPTWTDLQARLLRDAKRVVDATVCPPSAWSSDGQPTLVTVTPPLRPSPSASITINLRYRISNLLNPGVPQPKIAFGAVVLFNAAETAGAVIRRIRRVQLPPWITDGGAVVERSSFTIVETGPEGQGKREFQVDDEGDGVPGEVSWVTVEGGELRMEDRV